MFVLVQKKRKKSKHSFQDFVLEIDMFPEQFYFLINNLNLKKN